MTDASVKEILQALLARVQQLQVQQDVLQSRLLGSKTAGDLLDVQKAAAKTVLAETKELASKIEAL